MKTLANILQTWVYFSKDFTFHLSQSLSSTNWVAKISSYIWRMARWAQLFPKCVTDRLEVCGHWLMKWVRTCRARPVPGSFSRCWCPSGGWGWAPVLAGRKGVAFSVQKTKEPGMEVVLCCDGLMKPFLRLHLNQTFLLSFVWWVKLWLVGGSWKK